MSHLRIATYNVHKCRGLDWRVSSARVLKVLQEIDADIVAVQEVFAKQAAHLGEDLFAYRIFGPARVLDGQEYGNAIFSRLPIAGSQNCDLSVTRREARFCLRADLKFSRGRLVHFFAAHLGTSFFERRHQASKLLSPDVLEFSKRNGPRVLAGDFNEWTRGLVSRMLSAHMRSADVTCHLKRSRTYPGILPFLHLDHIYYDPPLRLIRMNLHRTSTAMLASDHLPLIADFEFAA